MEECKQAKGRGRAGGKREEDGRRTGGGREEEGTGTILGI